MKTIFPQADGKYENIFRRILVERCARFRLGRRSSSSRKAAAGEIALPILHVAVRRWRASHLHDLAVFSPLIAGRILAKKSWPTSQSA